jgi:hypothetical protein
MDEMGSYPHGRGAAGADAYRCSSMRLRGRRRVPSVDREIVIPCAFFDLDKLYLLDLFDKEGRVVEALTGEIVPREKPPYDPLTAWLTMAILGLIERGGPLLAPGLDRDRRLDLAREVLNEDEFAIVETIAVPRRYREMEATHLAAMVRTAKSHLDRMWAACWLILVGWTRSADCTFRQISEMPQGSLGELEEMVVDGFARGIGVRGRDDIVGWCRIEESCEAQWISWRLGTCETYYEVNGPPPYECVQRTVAGHRGWKKMVRLLPES